MAELHRRMDKNELARMDDLNKALSSLEIERAALERVPTWPWERGTLRSLVAAILIPLLIFVIRPSCSAIWPAEPRTDTDDGGRLTQ